MSWTTLARGGMAVLALGILGAAAARYHPFFSDDAFIALRYAERFASGLGLTFTDGERVEGYTDLLWVLLNAPAVVLGADAVTWARALGLLGAAAAVLLVGIAPEAPRLALVPVRLASASLLVATSAPVAIWAIGGLEHGFMLGVLAAGLVLTLRALETPTDLRRFLVAGVPFGALALLRADGIVLGGLATLAVAGALPAPTGRAAWHRALVFAAPAGLLVLAQLAFRALYYGSLVPNTALVKVSFSGARVVRGLEHVASGARPLTMLLVAAAIACLFVALSGVPRRRWLPPLMLGLGWPAYVAAVGGDIFPGWRQLALAIVPLALLVGAAASSLAAELDPRRRGGVTALVLWVPLLAFHLRLQERDPENQRAAAELWEWAGQPIGQALAVAFAARRPAPLLAVDAAGALPYWSKLPTLDMLGLTDRHIASHPPPGFGQGSIGHELGDGRYVLGRGPDLIAFCNASGHHTPCFLSGRQIEREPAFFRDYRPLRLEHGGVRASLWVRQEGGVLGVRRAQDSVEVPGYLFAGEGAAPAVLAGAPLAARVSPGAPGIARLHLEGGRWQVHLAGGGPAVQARFICGRRSAGRLAGDTTILALDRPGEVQIVVSVASGAGSFALTEARLRRAPAALSGWNCPADDGVVQVALADLAVVKAEGAFWAADAFIFGEAGVTVALPAGARPRRLSVSVDNNDRYTVEYRNHDRTVAVSSFGPRPNQGGLAVYDLEVPAAARGFALHGLAVKPVRGDGNYSLGHLVLADGPP